MTNEKVAGTASTAAAEIAAPQGDRSKAGSSLLEKEAIRFAESLDDYEHVEVIDIGGEDPHDYWLVVRDRRFELDYELTSHCDYWDFVGAIVEHRQCLSLKIRAAA